MVRIPSDRSPTHPGVMLREEFLRPLGITQRELADAILVPYQRVNEIIDEKRGITANTALRLVNRCAQDASLSSSVRWRYIQLGVDKFNLCTKICT